MRLDHDTGTSLWLVWYSRKIFCCLSTACNYSETPVTNTLNYKLSMAYKFKKAGLCTRVLLNLSYQDQPATFKRR